MFVVLGFCASPQPTLPFGDFLGQPLEVAEPSILLHGASSVVQESRAGEVQELR